MCNHPKFGVNDISVTLKYVDAVTTLIHSIHTDRILSAVRWIHEIPNARHLQSKPSRGTGIPSSRGSEHGVINTKVVL